MFSGGTIFQGPCGGGAAGVRRLFEDQMREEEIEKHYEARDAYVQSLGTPDDDLLAPLVNPSFVGGPRWPSLREAWRRVTRGGHTIIVSDGLSDPFDHETEPNIGFGIEILLETPDPIQGPVQGPWLFQLIYHVSQQAGHSGEFRNLRDEIGLFSMELPPCEGCEAFVSPESRIGVLFGLKAPRLKLDWTLPAGLVRVVTAKLLHPSELALVRSTGSTGRRRLQALFDEAGTYHLSSRVRNPVV